MSIQFPRQNSNVRQAGPGMGRTPDFQSRRHEGAQRPQQGGWGQDSCQFGRRGAEQGGQGGPRQMEGGRHGGFRQHEGFGRRDQFQRTGGPGFDPSKRAEALFTQLDTNKDGTVTQDEALAFFQAEAAKRQQVLQQAPAPEQAVPAETTDTTTVATPESDTPAVDPSAPLVTSPDTAATDTTPPVETVDASTTPDDSQAIDPAAAQAQAVAQLEALAQQDGLTDDQKAVLTKAHDDIQALDPADPDFVTKLQTALAPLLG